MVRHKSFLAYAPACSLRGAGLDQPPTGTNYGSNSLALGLTGRYPLFNCANVATVAQARTALQASRSVLEIAEQDLIVRVEEAYFDVLAAQDALGTTRASKAAISSSWLRPSATYKLAPPPSPTPAKPRRASTSPPSRSWRPRTTC